QIPTFWIGIEALAGAGWRLDDSRANGGIGTGAAGYGGRAGGQRAAWNSGRASHFWGRTFAPALLRDSRSELAGDRASVFPDGSFDGAGFFSQFTRGKEVRGHMEGDFGCRARGDNRPVHGHL